MKFLVLFLYLFLLRAAQPLATDKAQKHTPKHFKNRTAKNENKIKYIKNTSFIILFLFQWHTLLTISPLIPQKPHRNY
jgi:hypothetical protein